MRGGDMAGVKAWTRRLFRRRWGNWSKPYQGAGCVWYQARFRLSDNYMQARRCAVWSYPDGLSTACEAIPMEHREGI